MGYIRRIFLNLFKFLDHPHHSENDPVDFSHNGDFLFVPEIFSARKHLYLETTSLLVFVSLLVVSLTWILKTVFGASMLTVVSGAISLFYLGLMIFKLVIV